MAKYVISEDTLKALLQQAYYHGWAGSLELSQSSTELIFQEFLDTEPTKIEERKIYFSN